MINKIYKIINNKYSKFFKFFFFLRYVFAIFLIAIFLFLIIPKFFNYQKKEEILKEYLASYYDLEINGYSSITYEIFPLPNLSIKEVNFKVKDKPVFLNTKNFNIFLNFKNIYNYEDFVARKILLSDNEINLDIDKTKDALVYFGKLKYKFDVKKLNLNLKKKNNSIIEIKKISFSNYGYQKNKIKGEIFDKEFESYLNNDDKNLNFKILNTGIMLNFNFDEISKTNSISGTSKISILDNYLKLNFIMGNEQVSITKANLRNKNLSISFDSLVKYNPFFVINSDIRINKINKNFINGLSLEKILENKEILKKFNGSNKIIYNKKRSHNNLINRHDLKLDLAHGRLTFSSKIFILGGIINCNGDSLFIEEYPRLNFNCLFDIQDKKKLLKKFSLSQKLDKEAIRLKVIGSLNLLNKKINFYTIKINNKFVAKEEDINFFKESFERLLFDEGFFDIFKTTKIKEYLLEII